MGEAFHNAPGCAYRIATVALLVLMILPSVWPRLNRTTQVGKTTAVGPSRDTGLPVPLQDFADHVVHFLVRQFGEHRERDTARGVTF